MTTTACIDVIFPVYLSVSSLPWSCDFEDEFDDATMCNITQSVDDDFDWMLGSGGTPSRHTGPESARTGSHYVYIEASSPRTEGDVAE